jgi:Domain of unknown function (DUF1816)
MLKMTLSTTHNNNTGTSGSNWWLEIGTVNPRCLYFFGPFEDQLEAESSKEGFSQDLEGENARVRCSKVKFCQPRQLTLDGNELTIHNLKHSLSAFWQIFAKR